MDIPPFLSEMVDPIIIQSRKPMFHLQLRTHNYKEISYDKKNVIEHYFKRGHFFTNEE